MNLTDNEIVKSLEVCTGKRPLEDCPECPNYISESHCKVMLSEVALDLIKRQKAEIETLSVQVKCSKRIIQRLKERILTSRTEAIKEVADKLETELAHLEEYFIEAQDWSARNTVLQVISKIKEMVGDTE